MKKRRTEDRQNHWASRRMSLVLPNLPVCQVLKEKIESLERVNPKPSPIHSAPESEWTKAKAMLHCRLSVFERNQFDSRGMSSSTREQMEFPLLEVMMFRDHILTSKQLEGERINEEWGRFKELLVQCPTHEILDIVLLDCFYRYLGPGNKVLTDQLIPGGITQQPYVIAAHLLDHMAEEQEKGFMLAALMTQMDELAKKIVEIEVQCKRKDKYIPPHERRRPTDNEGKRVEGMCSIILHKVNEHDRLLEEMKENIKVMKQMIGSHSRSMHLLENLMSHVMPHLYPQQNRGLPSDVMANPISGV
uniref:Retrotransposon gag protein n=1 Tax=Solanum tuberosum TaxID=4113 RepID=M1DVW0_SOLTU